MNASELLGVGVLGPVDSGQFRQTRLGGLDDIRSLAKGGTVEERRTALHKASKEFEAIFIQQMIAAMRKTVGDGELIKKSNGEKVFEGMLDEEWSKTLAGKGGPNSLSEMIYRQLSRSMGLEEENVAPARNEGEFRRWMRATNTVNTKPPSGDMAEKNGHE